MGLLLKKDESLGRNDRCPKCGNKGKDCKGHVPKSVGRILAVLTTISLTVCLYIAVISYTDWQAEQRNKRVRSAGNITLEHINSRQPDRWWMNTPPQMPTTDESRKLAQQTFDYNERIKRLLAAYRHVSPLADEIAQTFQNRTVSIFTNGVSMSLFFKENSDSTEYNIESDIEVCFVPQDQTKLLKQGSEFFFRRNWNALMLPAVEYPDAVLSGLLFHELGHALRYRQGAPSSNATTLSDSYIEEEVEMHELEMEIFDKASGGAFIGYIDSIITREKQKLKTARDAILCVGKEDLRHLDSILGAKQSGPVVSNVLTAQYNISVGLRYLERRQQNVTMGEKVALYRWLTQSYREGVY